MKKAVPAKVYHRPNPSTIKKAVAVEAADSAIRAEVPVDKPATAEPVNCSHCGANSSELEEFRKWKREREWRAARGLT